METKSLSSVMTLSFDSDELKQLGRDDSQNKPMSSIATSDGNNDYTLASFMLSDSGDSEVASDSRFIM